MGRFIRRFVPACYSISRMNCAVNINAVLFKIYWLSTISEQVVFLREISGVRLIGEAQGDGNFWHDQTGKDSCNV